MSIPILTVRDADGNIIKIPAIKGDKGDKGDPYTLTEEDKQQIAESIAINNQLVSWIGSIRSLPLGLSFFVGDATIAYDSAETENCYYDVKNGSIITVGIAVHDNGDESVCIAHITEPDGTTIHFVPTCKDVGVYYTPVKAEIYSNGDEVAY